MSTDASLERIARALDRLVKATEARARPPAEIVLPETPCTHRLWRCVDCDLVTPATPAALRALAAALEEAAVPGHHLPEAPPG